MSIATESSQGVPPHLGTKALRPRRALYSANRLSPQDALNSALHGTVLANILFITNTLLRSGTTLLLMPVLIALLGGELYALWVTISTITMYLSLSESGLGQTVVNKVGEAYARGDLRRVGEVQATAHILYWLLVVPTAIAALICLACLPVDRWLLSNSDMHHGRLLIACMMVSTVLALARIPMLVFPGLLTGLRQLPLRLACEMAATVLVAAGTVLVAWLGAGVIGLTVATNLLLFASTASVSLLVTHKRPWARLRLSQFRVELLLPLATNSGFFFLMSLAVVLDRSALTLLVAKLGSLALAPPVFFLLSIFRVAAWSLISAMSRAVQPYVLMWWAQNDHQRIATVAGLSTKLTSIAAGLFAACFVPFAEPMTNAWVGPGSFPGMTPLLFIVSAFLIDAVFLASTNLLVVMNGHRKLAIVICLKSLLTVALAALCGTLASDPLIGLTMGALLATCIGNAAMPLLTCNALGMSMRQNMDHLVIRPLVYSMSITAFACALTGLPSVATKVVMVFGFVAIASAIAWIFVLDPNERRVCKQSWSRVLHRKTDLASPIS